MNILISAMNKLADHEDSTQANSQSYKYRSLDSLIQPVQLISAAIKIISQFIISPEGKLLP